MQNIYPLVSFTSRRRVGGISREGKIAVLVTAFDAERCFARSSEETRGARSRGNDDRKRERERFEATDERERERRIRKNRRKKEEQILDRRELCEARYDVM